MSKYIKLHSPLVTRQDQKLRKTTFKSFNAATLAIRILSIIAFLLVVFIAIKAFYLGSVFFSNIIIGLFIVGCSLLVKSLGEQKVITKK